MNYHLIQKWNSVVKPTDTVYHLGDFMKDVPIKDARKVVDNLNGNITLIRGNHDRIIDNFSYRFHDIKDYLELKVTFCPGNYKVICLMHYPLYSWNIQHQGSYMLHGHCHGKNDINNHECLRLDIGVDVHNYTPVSLKEVLKIMAEKQVYIKSLSSAK